MVRCAPNDISKSAALPAYLAGQTTRITGSDSFPLGLNRAKAIDLRSLFFGTDATIRRGSGNVSTFSSITLGLFTVSRPTAVPQSSELGRGTEPLTRESRFDSSSRFEKGVSSRGDLTEVQLEQQPTSRAQLCRACRHVRRDHGMTKATCNICDLKRSRCSERCDCECPDFMATHDTGHSDGGRCKQRRWNENKDLETQSKHYPGSYTDDEKKYHNAPFLKGGSRTHAPFAPFSIPSLGLLVILAK